MSETILTLDQHEMDASISATDREKYKIRHAARAVLFDATGRVALMYAGQRDYYKLPGGGIDEGEDIQAALARELIEETGSTAQITQELGTVVEWRDSSAFKQVSYAFKAQLIATFAPPSFTQSELDEGFAMRWAADIDEAIELVEARADSEDSSVMFMTRRDAAILRAAK